MHFSYERYLINRLRQAFGYEGTPIRIITRRRTRRWPARAAKEAAMADTKRLERTLRWC